MYMIATKNTEKEGFEPSHRFHRPTPFPGEPLQPLGYFSKKTEGVGFEPTAPFEDTGFQDRLLKPLGHPSKKNIQTRL